MQLFVSCSEENCIITYDISNYAIKEIARTVLAGQPFGLACSQDGKFLYAHVRPSPFRMLAFQIATDGKLSLLNEAPALNSISYIALDNTSRCLLSVSYGANEIYLATIAEDGKIAAPHQVIASCRNPHSIQADKQNKFLFAPALGADQIQLLKFDAASKTASYNTPAVLQLKELAAGPRHFYTSYTNDMLYILCELSGSLVSAKLNGNSGILEEYTTVSALPPGHEFVHGRLATPSSAPRSSQDIWCSDIAGTADGKMLFTLERSTSMLSIFAIDSEKKPVFQRAIKTVAEPWKMHYAEKERALIVAGKRANSLALYSVDSTSYTVEQRDEFETGRAPIWLTTKN